jgi:guanyl-specific ribonuclease Sa
MNNNRMIVPGIYIVTIILVGATISAILETPTTTATTTSTATTTFTATSATTTSTATPATRPTGITIIIIPLETHHIVPPNADVA